MKTSITIIPRVLIGAFLSCVILVLLGMALWAVSAGFVAMEAIEGNSAGEAFWGHLCHVGLIPLLFILHLPY